MIVMININNVIIIFKTYVCVLNLQINFKLKWDFHIKFIKTKMITQCMILSKIIVSIWNAFFVKTQQMYSTMICSMMTYASMIWHNSIDKFNKKTCDKLSIIKNKYLCMITNAFKIILIKMLKIKFFILFLNIHLNHVQIKIKMRLHNFDQTKQIRVVCEKVLLWLCKHHDKQVYIKFIFDKRKMFWTMKLTYKFIFKCAWFKTQ